MEIMLSRWLSHLSVLESNLSQALLASCECGFWNHGRAQQADRATDIDACGGRWLVKTLEPGGGGEAVGVRQMKVPLGNSY